MTGQQLRNSILQEAIQGRLVKQNPEDESVSILLESIQQAKIRLIKEGRIKKDKETSLLPEENIPFAIPDSWRWVRVQDLFNVRSALRIHQTDWKNEGIPFFRGRELVQLANTGHTKPEIFISRELYESNKAKGGVPQKNDLLISAVGTIGKVYIVQGTKEFYYKDAYILCFENFANIYVDYIKYALESPYLQEEIHRDSMATTVAQLTIIKAKSLLIPFPPVSEQKKIVEKIESLLPLVDEYDNAAGELKALNETLPNKLRKSVLQEAIKGTLVSNDISEGELTAPELLQQILKERQEKENKEKGKKAKKLTLSTIEEEPWELPDGWCWCCLGDIVLNRDSERVPLSVDVRERQINKQYDYYGPGGAFDKVEGYLFDKRLLLIGEDGANLLTRSKPNAFFAEGKYWVNNHVHVLDSFISDTIILDYIALRINGMSLADYVTGTAQPKMNQEKMNSIPIPLPPLSVQHQIVEKVEEVFSTINKLESSK